MKNKELHKHIYKFLSNISNSVGDTITEYHWREAADLMIIMQYNKLVKTHHIFIDNNTYDMLTEENLIEPNIQYYIV